MKELPLTKMTLQSVTEVSNKDSLINQLQTLKELLLKSPLTKEGSQLLKFLDRLSLSQQKEPFDSFRDHQGFYLLLRERVW